jgi:nucleoside-diphosphate-sugar epimerase
MMRVLVAGTSGAIGTRLIPQLVARGHEVIGTSRVPDRAERLHALGAEPVVLDLLDPPAVRKAVLDTKPESRGASNVKAKRELGWSLRHPSWRQGFVEAYT